MIFGILSTESIETHQNVIVNVGVALQLTNILRYIYEDAHSNRCFIPNQLSLKYGIDKNIFLISQSNTQT